MASPSNTVTDVEAFMQEARERYQLGRNADQEDRTAGEDDVLFEAGEQWDTKAKEQRAKAGRPCLTENKLPVFVAQVVNDGRQSKPSIRVTPLDDGKPETAQFYQDRIRHIEYDSDADIAYDTAREGQVVSGRGFLRVRTQYKKGSMRQELVIEPIDDQFSVVWDPTAKRYDRQDAEWCFVDAGVISKAEYRRRYGKDTDLGRANFFEGADNAAQDWVGVGADSGVRIAEYWKKRWEKRTLLELADGSVMYADVLPQGLGLSQQREVVDQREEDWCILTQYIIDGVGILNETEWLTSEFPIVPQWGKQRTVKGKRLNSSLIRNVKHSQVLVNLYVTSMAEHTAQLPKTPWFIPVGGIPQTELANWARIHTDPLAYALYNPYDEDGKPLPPPTRNVAEPPIQSLVIGLRQAIDAIKAGMGIFDSSLGAESNETSGIAIQRRQKEADNANFHFHDNEARTRRALGRILIPLIDLLDAGEQTVATRTEDGKTKFVRVNTADPYPDQESGEMIHHQLGQGDYGVAVSTGPSYTSQRQEAADREGELIKAVPDLLWIWGDKYFRKLDSPGAEEIADRMEKAINLRSPGLIEPKQQGQQPIPPQLQQQIQEAIGKRDQLIDQLTEQLKTLGDEVRAKKFQLDSNERIKMAELALERDRLQADILLAEAKMGSAEAIARLGHELQIIQAERQRETAAAAAPPAQSDAASIDAAAAPGNDGGVSTGVAA